MPVDLVSACVFCGSFLFGADVRPIDGLSADFGLSYSTFGRQIERAGGETESSDTTGKFISIGMGNAWPAKPDLGAGTPAGEWRAQLALAPSHDEGDAIGAPPGTLAATGTGRFENFALLFRLPVTDADSIEVAWSRRYHRPTDVLTSPDRLYLVVESRTLAADRIDLGLGWRHRWQGIEAQLAARYVRPNSSNGTIGAFQITRGQLYGASAELRAALASAATVWISGERASGRLDATEESQPDFANKTYADDSLLEAYQLGAARSWTKTSVSVSGGYERTRLPFVSESVLGTETLDFDAGDHPRSRSTDWVASARLEYTVATNVHVGFLLRLDYGSETVSLTDSRGQLPPEELAIGRHGVFGAGLSRALGSPEPTLALTARFALSPPAPAAP